MRYMMNKNSGCMRYIPKESCPALSKNRMLTFLDICKSNNGIEETYMYHTRLSLPEENTLAYIRKMIEVCIQNAGNHGYRDKCSNVSLFLAVCLIVYAYPDAYQL